MTIRAERIDGDVLLESPKLVELTGGPVHFNIRCLSTEETTEISLFGGEIGKGGLIIDNKRKVTEYQAGASDHLVLEIPGRDSIRKAILYVTGS